MLGLGNARHLGILVACLASLAHGCARDATSDDKAAKSAAHATTNAPASATPLAAPVDDGPPMRLYASKYVSKIRSAPSKDAPRIGYMRGGAVLMAKSSKPLGFDACRKGWYELETGGFICSTTDAIAFLGKKLPERRPTQPVFDKPLPYPYGYSKSKSTPLYKRLPTDDEAALYEGYKIPGAVAAVPDGGIAPAPVAGEAPTAPQAPAVEAPVLANGQGPQPAAVSGELQAAEVVPAPQIAGAPGAGDPDAGGPPTLASLLGEQGSVLLRRMERGFYVSLDREISKGARGYWQTQAAGYIPEKRLYMVEGSEFHGVDLAAGGLSLPIGFVLAKATQAYALDAKGRMHGAGHPAYHFAFPIASDADVKGKHYYVDATGTHYPSKDVTRLELRARPAEVLADEKWIDVDLTTQSLVAYVGDAPVYATLISSGRIKDELDPLRNFETPKGEFRLTSKHLTATMDGDHSIDGPYSIEDVPYVMYFQLAYALHSAFWHNSFGRPRSHGCINLAPADAKWIFFWATPELPKSWHGVYPDQQHPGTRIFIHGDTPKG